jgi:hypothetical protein
MTKRYKIDDDGLMYDVHELRELASILASRLYSYLTGTPALVERAQMDLQLAHEAHDAVCENCHEVSHTYVFSEDKEHGEIEAPDAAPNLFASYGTYIEHGQPQEKKEQTSWQLPDLGDDLWDKIGKLGS